jgi:hypothetical protein
MASSSVQICKNFQNGTCKYGKNCRYSHTRQLPVARGTPSLCLSYTALGITKTYTELELKTLSNPESIKRDGHLGMCRLKTLISIARAENNPYLVADLEKYIKLFESAFEFAAKENSPEILKAHMISACQSDKFPTIIYVLLFSSDNNYRRLGRQKETAAQFELLKNFGFETESYYAKRIADEKAKAELAILKQQAKSMTVPDYKKTTAAQHAACANSAVGSWADFDEDEEIFYIQEINDFVTGHELRTNLPLKMYIEANRVCCF